MDLIKRYKGCLLGLAAGDALGTTLEFKRPGSFKPIEDMVGGGPFNLSPGQWTDDTSMALCLAESLIEHQSFNLFDQLSKYWKWYQEGYLSSTGECFDIGTTTVNALYDFHKSGKTHAITKPTSAGNGCIMRLAPVPMFYSQHPKLAIKMCAESSKTTHNTTECIDACRYFGGLIVGALNGESKETLLSPYYAPGTGIWSAQPLTPKISEISLGLYKNRQPPTIEGSGYVVRSLEAAIWAFYNSNSFEEGALLAVNLGDDADTTGAIYGQLAGAYYGLDAIPQKWRDLLTFNEKIENYAYQLFKLAQLVNV